MLAVVIAPLGKRLMKHAADARQKLANLTVAIVHDVPGWSHASFINFLRFLDPIGVIVPAAIVPSEPLDPDFYGCLFLGHWL
jgi:hypothetical protein